MHRLLLYIAVFAGILALVAGVVLLVVFALGVILPGFAGEAVPWLG